MCSINLDTVSPSLSQQINVMLMELVILGFKECYKSSAQMIDVSELLVQDAPTTGRGDSQMATSQNCTVDDLATPSPVRSTSSLSLSLFKKRDVVNKHLFCTK
ncbi:hypothetical protein KIN20_026002 [Parelaphostrongylus tenuis]|uniref:Uncharacterized protein n=1 Tax=Parelaphostrongylus tenuis TaxID=148309 RepID=A0AAD5QX93_PARTN|nr:hypothetical protein KIN20_026002 [Parelaphostrongylus tenuis]